MRQTIKPFRTITALAVLLFMLFSSPIHSFAAPASDPIFSLTAYKDGRQEDKGTAFAIAQGGWILTSAKTVANADRIVLTNSALGAVDAHFVAADQALDLALLRADVDVLPAVFSLGEASGGEAVSSVGYWDGTTLQTAHGMLVGPLAGTSSPVSHNALFGEGGYGSVLVNACGEVVGANRSNPDGSSLGAHPYAIAATISQIGSFAQSNGVNINRVDTPCAGPATSAASDAQAAQARADAAERQLVDLQRSQAASEQQKRAAERVADEMKKEAADAWAKNELLVREAQAARSAVAQRQKTAEMAKAQEMRIRRLSLQAAAVGGLVLVVVLLTSLIVVVRVRKRRRFAELDAIAARQDLQRSTTPPAGARDLLLEGVTSQGERFAIKIPALALDEQRGGAVIGRNPSDAEFVINREKVSRRHCRFFVADEVLYVEDLGSTNGTMVNGVVIVQKTAVNDADILRLGDAEIRIREA